MPTCKHCQSDRIVKNGFVREKQRYYCHGCERRFVCGDERIDPDLVVKKALAVILYSVGKASFGFLGRLFGVSRSLVYRWIAAEAARLPEPAVSSAIKEIELDEMWHFVGSKKTRFGSSKRWIVAHGELWHGLRVVVMLQPSDASMTN